jgi:DNA-binding transcriptional LysR family regulator
MNLSRLTTFCRVYELRSFSQAAEKLYLSQPTVSSHILVLENQLGQRLFDRLGRLIAPTQAGKLLYARAIKAINQVEQALEEINVLRDKVSGPLVIGASTIPGHYFLPSVMSQYNRHYPEVSLQLRVDDSEAIAKLVAFAEVDLGIIGKYKEDPELVCEPLAVDSLVVLGHERFFSAGGTEGLTREQMQHLPWIVREQGSGTRKAMEQGLRELDVRLTDLPIVATVDSTVTALQCVTSGLGVTITSRWAAQLWTTDRGIVGIDPGWAFERSFYLLWHRQRSPSIAASSFSVLLRQHMDSISAGSKEVVSL